jgi:hypothetical protein
MDIVLLNELGLGRCTPLSTNLGEVSFNLGVRIRRAFLGHDYRIVGSSELRRGSSQSLGMNILIAAGHD